MGIALNAVNYRAEIDGLRALAVLPVILFHAGFSWFSGGYVGVDVFFVISGYLITTIIIAELAEGRFSLTVFYERRARRILPALFFVMLFSTLFALLWLAPSELKDFGQGLIAVSTFWSNVLFWQQSGYFETAAELNPLLHTWSLAVEEQFYIFFPLLLLLAWRISLKFVCLMLVVIFVLSISAAQWGVYQSPSAAFYLLPMRAWELLIGSAIALYLRFNRPLDSRLANEAISLLGLAMVVFAIVAFDQTTPFPGVYAVLPTLGTALLILCATPSTTVCKVLSLKPLVALGLISYSAYLWHQPVLAFARYRLSADLPDFLLLALCLLAVAMAWLSWRYVEQPFRDKDRFSQKFIFQTSVLVIASLCGMGFWLHQSDGGLDFYAADEQTVFQSFVRPAVYVAKRHGTIRLQPFDKNNDKPDILIIGDSHSEDLVNAVYEAEMQRHFEFSSFYIPVRCGVLFVADKSDREEERVDCPVWPNYGAMFQQVAQAADQVWVVSSWRPLDVKYMRQSLINLKALNTDVFLFGRKYFGRVSAGDFRNGGTPSWLAQYVDDTSDRDAQENAALNRLLEQEAQLEDVTFIDTQKVICNGLDRCPNHVDGGVMSHDGSHLTPFGAARFGAKLAQLFDG